MQLSEADNQADVMTAPYTYMHAGVDVSSRGRRLRPCLVPHQKFFVHPIESLDTCMKH